MSGNLNVRSSSVTICIEGLNIHPAIFSINHNTFTVDGSKILVLFFSKVILVVIRVWFGPISLLNVIHRPFLLLKIILDCICVFLDILFNRSTSNWTMYFFYFFNNETNIVILVFFKLLFK